MTRVSDTAIRQVLLTLTSSLVPLLVFSTFFGVLIVLVLLPLASYHIIPEIIARPLRHQSEVFLSS